MPKTYCLDDKLSVAEYQNKTLRKLIDMDKGLIHLMLKTKEIKFSAKARAYLFVQLKKVGAKYQSEYHVDDRIMKAYNRIPMYAR